MATITSGSGSSAVTTSTSNPSTPPARAVALTDGDGNLLAFTPTGGLAAASGTAAVTNLNAVTATGAGSWVDLGTVHAKHVMQTVITGAPASVSITLEGSLDGSHAYGAALATSTSTTGDAQFAIDKPARYLRANLGTLTGGTTPHVTALIGST